MIPRQAQARTGEGVDEVQTGGMTSLAEDQSKVDGIVGENGGLVSQTKISEPGDGGRAEV